jgi:hypothetical protein
MEPEDRNHTGTKDYSVRDWFFYFIFGGVPPQESHD